MAFLPCKLSALASQPERYPTAQYTTISTSLGSASSMLNVLVFTDSLNGENDDGLLKCLQLCRQRKNPPPAMPTLFCRSPFHLPLATYHPFYPITLAIPRHHSNILVYRFAARS